MKSTKYVEPFIKEVDYWEKALGYVAECIEVSSIIHVKQCSNMYLRLLQPTENDPTHRDKRLREYGLKSELSHVLNFI